MDQWLLRTSDNWISGPYPAEQVRQMILQGQLGLQDEICLACDFWFQIRDRDEVRAKLGVEVPVLTELEEDEITETKSSLSQKEITAPEIEIGLKGSYLENSFPEGTSVIQLVAPQDLSQTLSPPEVSRQERPQVASPGVPPQRQQVIQESMHFRGAPYERSLLWRILAWLMVLVSAGIIAAVIRFWGFFWK